MAITEQTARQFRRGLANDLANPLGLDLLVQLRFHRKILRRDKMA